MVQFFVEKVQGIDRASLEAAVSPVLSAHGVESVELSHQKEREGWVLRVVVESLRSEASSEPSVHVGLLADISRDLSTALDVADFIPHAYTLEVSSAGLERPLRSLRDLLRAKDSVVKVHLVRPAADGQRVLRGRLTNVDAGGMLTVEVDGKPLSAPVADIERAHTVYELPARPKRERAGKTKRH
jgi:ribosome maturation factor RimP